MLILFSDTSKLLLVCLVILLVLSVRPAPGSFGQLRMAKAMLLGFEPPHFEVPRFNFTRADSSLT